MSDLRNALDEAARTLAGARRIVALGHIGPDGDALGSALAVALAARNAGKEAWASFGHPFVVGDEFRFLAMEPLVDPDTLTDEYDVVVACDTANPDRLGSALPIARRAGTLIVVDHHRSNDGFGDIRIVDPDAAATVELILALLDRLEWPVDAATATALYTGLVTDTGRFQYSSTTPRTHEVAARLVGAGAEPPVVGRHVYEESAFGYLAVLGAVLARAVLDTDAGLVWSVMRRDDLTHAGIGYQDADGLIDVLRIAREADVACLLKEMEPGVLKGSLRSRGRVDVNAIAARFGGGGHHNAAGFTTNDDVDAVIDRIRDALT